jgi:DNA-binding NarL/FixJ family response regulator
MRTSRLVTKSALPPRKHRVLIVDDHNVVRRGVSDAVSAEPDMLVCGEAASGLEAAALVLDAKPDIVVLDLTLPDIDGIEAIRGLRAASPTVKIVVLTMHEHAQLARAALRAGASGYILKSDALSDLPTAVRQVARGTKYLSGRFAEAMVAHFVSTQVPSPPPLSAKEMEIVTLLARGKRNREIAADLGISSRTVESHRHRLMRKLNFSSLSELVRFAVRNQLVEP